MTKTDLINKICKLDTSWEDKRGRLYYMCLDDLKKLYARLLKNANNSRNVNNNVMAGFQTN